MIRAKLLAGVLFTMFAFGSIEKGKYADVIAVSGDPFEDISEL